MSKVNLPPESEILYEVWSEDYRDEFPDWDFESDPVISNPNFWDYGIRWRMTKKDSVQEKDFMPYSPSRRHRGVNTFLLPPFGGADC